MSTVRYYKTYTIWLGRYDYYKTVNEQLYFWSDGGYWIPTNWKFADRKEITEAEMMLEML